MFFSIPDTTEISAKKSNTQHGYTLFNIHINGIYHCSLRYSQLRIFNDELHRLFPNSMINIQPFPPKKFFTLSSREIDERRILLERYLQSIVQNKILFSSSYFNNFFLNAQCETISNESIEKISLTIYFLNQHNMIIENLSPYDNTIKLFDACINKIQLDKEYSIYFSLFFYEKFNIIRPLFSFESPYISLKQIEKSNENIFIVFKKSYWDINYDLKLLDNRQTLKLVFIQSQYDIEQSKEFDSNDIYNQLDNYSKKNLFKDYIFLSRSSKFYGYIIIKDCLINNLITEKLCQCLLTIGNNELICYLYNNDEKNLFVEEISFKVTRIRCWKVNSIKQDMNISFEYLIKKDTLQWIIIHTKQAPLVSTCLQSMIDEILAKKIDAMNSMSILNRANNQTNIVNSLTTRTPSDLNRFNNNKLFDEGDGDDDL